MSMDDVTRFTTALEQNPEDIPSYLGRAEAYSAQGYFQQAIEDYDRVIGLINKHKANALMSAGDLQGALDVFTQAITLNPNDAMSYLSRGIALSTMGNNQQAVEDFNAALTLNPNDAAAYHNRGIAFRPWAITPRPSPTMISPCRSIPMTPWSITTRESPTSRPAITSSSSRLSRSPPRWGSIRRRNS